MDGFTHGNILMNDFEYVQRKFIQCMIIRILMNEREVMS